MPRSVALGDVNGDGKIDIATADSGSNTVSTLLGAGAGVFATHTQFIVGDSPLSVSIGDLNGDGKPDLATANFNSMNASVLLATGGGGFAAQRLFGVAFDPNTIAMGNLNGDGKLDLVTANSSGTGLSVLLNSIPYPTTSGVALYGTGTAGCAGVLSLTANSVPSIGNASFAIVGSNAPVNSVGLTIGSDVSLRNGSDTLGVNIAFHVAFAGATELFALDASSGPSGEQFAAVPIPSNPSLVGKTYFVQSFWVEPAIQRCTQGLAGLVSSRGLSITIQP
jgi:hypothetical protein